MRHDSPPDREFAGPGSKLSGRSPRYQLPNCRCGPQQNELAQDMTLKSNAEELSPTAQEIPAQVIRVQVTPGLPKSTWPVNAGPTGGSKWMRNRSLP